MSLQSTERVEGFPLLDLGPGLQASPLPSSSHVVSIPGQLGVELRIGPQECALPELTKDETQHGWARTGMCEKQGGQTLLSETSLLFNCTFFHEDMMGKQSLEPGGQAG